MQLGLGSNQAHIHHLGQAQTLTPSHAWIGLQLKPKPVTKSLGLGSNLSPNSRPKANLRTPNSLTAHLSNLRLGITIKILCVLELTVNLIVVFIEALHLIILFQDPPPTRTRTCLLWLPKPKVEPVLDSRGDVSAWASIRFSY